MEYFDYIKEVVEDIFNSNMDIKEKKKELEIKYVSIESIEDEKCKSYCEVIKGYIYSLDTIIMVNDSLIQLEEYEKKYFENINSEFSLMRLRDLLILKNNVEMFEVFYINMIQKRVNSIELERIFRELVYRYKSIKLKLIPNLEFIESTNIYLEKIENINKNKDLSLNEMLRLHKKIKMEVQSLDVPNSKFIQGYIFYIISQINENIFGLANLGLNEEVKKRH